MDITNAESAGRWRELLAGAGARRAAISGDARLRQVFFDGDIRAYQVIVPDLRGIETGSIGLHEDRERASRAAERLSALT